MKKKFKLQYVLPVVFLGCIFGIGTANALSITPIVAKEIQEDPSYFSAGGTKIENTYRSNFWKRKEWINLFGASQKALGRRTISDGSFMLNEDGLLEQKTDWCDIPKFTSQLAELKERLDATGTPFLYVQMPPREELNSSDPPQLFQTRSTYQAINEEIADLEITRLDEAEILSGEGAPKLTDFYFKTDLHTTTKGEIWMTHKIAEKLQQEFGIRIDSLIEEDDPRFQKISHPFLGNLALSIGEFYAGKDTFEEYFPLFPTNFTVKDVLGTWEVNGSYKEVLTNGFDDNLKENPSPYWIINFMRYGAAGYHVENSKQTGPSLLFICDSQCYRTTSYLALECSNITMIDPRFDTEAKGGYLEKALADKEYDAVIYLHGSFGISNFPMFSDENVEP